MPRNLRPPYTVFHHFAGPKYREPKMTSHELRAGYTKRRCPYGIVKWTSSAPHMDALPSSCFSLAYPRASIGPTSSRTAFLFLSPTQGSSSTFTLLLIVSLLCIAVLILIPLVFISRRRAAVSIIPQGRPPPNCAVIPNLFG